MLLTFFQALLNAMIPVEVFFVLLLWLIAGLYAEHARNPARLSMVDHGATASLVRLFRMSTILSSFL